MNPTVSDFASNSNLRRYLKERLNRMPSALEHGPASMFRRRRVERAKKAAEEAAKLAPPKKTRRRFRH